MDEYIDTIEIPPVTSERNSHSAVRTLVADNIDDFIKLDIPLREMILDPILPAQGTAMLYSKRGVGKTYTALGIAFAVASGGSFLRWSSAKPRRVIYVDGEMTANVMQERLTQIKLGADSSLPAPDYFRLITPDRQPQGIPDLNTDEGQAAVEQWIGDGCELLVLDNLSTLCPNSKENDAESWTEMQQWLLKLRRQGVAVLIVHHAGKGGSQRGTSRREDILDTVIALSRPTDYEPSQGARFNVTYEKCRTIIGDAAKAFEVTLAVEGEKAVWSSRDLEDASLDLVREMLSEGMAIRKIAEELGIGKSTVHRLKKLIANA